MTSPPDVQNVPDVWALLERARSAAVELCVAAMPTSPDWHKWFEVRQEIDVAIAQRDRFVLVPLEPTPEIEHAWYNGPTSTHNRFREHWRNALAASLKPEGKP